MAAQQYHFDALWPIQKLGQVSSEKDTTEDHVVEAGTCMLPSFVLLASWVLALFPGPRAELYGTTSPAAKPQHTWREAAPLCQ